jgi:hypothetical protein
VFIDYSQLQKAENLLFLCSLAARVRQLIA